MKWNKNFTTSTYMKKSVKSKITKEKNIRLIALLNIFRR